MLEIMPQAILLVTSLGLIWLLMAAPLGERTIRRKRRLALGQDAVAPLLAPENFARWNPAILSAESLDVATDPEGDTRFRLVYRHPDRKNQPVERIFARTAPDAGLTIIDDSALDMAHWRHFREHRSVQAEGAGSLVTFEQTDRFRGLAPLVYRYVLMGRELTHLDDHLAGRKQTTSGLLESPSVQVILAVLSTFALWPFFGLTLSGLILSCMLTVVIVMHEFGHMAAYRAFGHTRVRMIFIPLLGGIAIGGRPYDRRFEVATCALMGPGISAFFVPILIAVAGSLSEDQDGLHRAIMTFLLILGGFNLMNLMPMSKFDGGQVLRQVFSNRLALALASFAVSGAVLWTGFLVGMPTNALLAGLAVFTLLSLIGAASTRPRHALDDMTDPQRLLVAFGFYAALSIHACAVVLACKALL